MVWTSDVAGLVNGDVRVSAQRFVRPAGGHVPTPPSSLGAIPFARLEGRAEFALALADDEAIWLGLTGPVGALRATAETVAGERVNVHGARISCGLTILVGLTADNDGFPTLDLSRVLGLRLLGAGDVVDIALMSRAAFARVGGAPLPKPLDPGLGYRGYRLP